LLRNCPPKQVIEEKMEGMRRRRRIRKQALNDLKEKEKIMEYKTGALNRALWRPRLGRAYGPVAKRTMQ